MSVVRRAIVPLIVASLSGAAAAEPEIGSRIDNARGSVSEADVASRDASSRAMGHFAQCKAWQRPQVAASILQMPYLSPEQQAALRKFSGWGDDDCMGFGDRALTFAPTAMIGGMAEALILSSPLKERSRTLQPATDDAVSKAGLAPRNLAEDFTQCVVEKDPVTVLSLVKSPIGSTNEAKFIGQLTPGLGPCLSKGQSLSLNKYAIRATLAYGLFRLMPVLTTAPQASK